MLLNSELISESIDLNNGLLDISQLSSNANRGKTIIGAGGISLNDIDDVNKLRMFMQQSKQVSFIIEGTPTVALGNNFKVINGNVSIETATVNNDLNIYGNVKVGGYTFQPINLTINGNTYTLLGVL